jgi:hypothetical protein
MIREEARRLRPKERVPTMPKVTLGRVNIIWLMQLIKDVR